MAAAAALALPATGALLAIGAPQASAAVVSPGNGASYTTPATVNIRADYGRSGTANALSVTPPGGGAVQVASAPGNVNGGTMSYDLDLGCWTSCTPAPNGTWTVTQSGGTSSSSTFVTRIAPQAPSGVSAEPTGSREVRVRWEAGPEPDLVGYALYEGSSVVKDGIGLSACDGGSCSTTVSYASEGSGAHSYSLRALRSAGPGSGSTLESPMSSLGLRHARGGARLAAGRRPGQRLERRHRRRQHDRRRHGGSTGGGTGGSTTGGTGGSTTAPGSGSGTPSSGPTSAPAAGQPGAPTGDAAVTGTSPSAAPGADPDQVAVAQRRAFATGFTAFGPKLGIPKLPPLPQAPSPEVAPLADGEFAPTLGFEDQVVTERVEAAGTSRVPTFVSSAVDSEQLARSTAGALVLLLAGAHLRRWLGAATPE